MAESLAERSWGAVGDGVSTLGPSSWVPAVGTQQQGQLVLRCLQIPRWSPERPLQRAPKLSPKPGPLSPESTNVTLTRETADQLALILGSGMPLVEAVRYFLDPQALEESPELVRQISDRWSTSKLLAQAIEKIQGKSWGLMSLEERINLAISKHYTEMAYYLYSRNYTELEGAARLKADTCRDSLEKKLAGTAGQRDALASFLADVKNGVVRLGQPITPPKPLMSLKDLPNGQTQHGSTQSLTEV